MPEVAAPSIVGVRSNATISNVAACQIREELLRQYSEAAESLVPLSKELTNVALSYEADMFAHIW